MAQVMKQASRPCSRTIVQASRSIATMPPVWRGGMKMPPSSSSSSSSLPLGSWMLGRKASDWVLMPKEYVYGSELYGYKDLSKWNAMNRIECDEDDEMGVCDTEDVTKKHDIVTRKDVTSLLLCAKKEKGWTFRDIAEKLQVGEVWLTSVILGQQSMKRADAQKLCDLLGVEKKLSAKVSDVLTDPPVRGLDFHTVFDPTIYRFFEIVQVYGPTLKALIGEKFGDGVLSPVDIKLDIKQTEKNRVKFIMEGRVERFQPF